MIKQFRYCDICGKEMQNRQYFLRILRKVELKHNLYCSEHGATVYNDVCANCANGIKDLIKAKKEQ